MTLFFKCERKMFLLIMVSDEKIYNDPDFYNISFPHFALQLSFTDSEWWLWKCLCLVVVLSA